MNKSYCCGFLFDLNGNRVLLIQKRKPAWQNLKYNGVGGAIEEGETPLNAMIREAYEETNLILPNWTNFCELKDENETFSVEFFYTYTNNISRYVSKTEEICEIFSTKLLPNVIQNLHWLIPMALNFGEESTGKFIIIEKGKK